MTIPLWLAPASALLIGYLLGSIPFGLVLTRLTGAGDLRQIGSGSIGATNVLRTGNKKLAAATLLLDALKGSAAAFIASYWGIEAGIAAGFAAFIGHLNDDFGPVLRCGGFRSCLTYCGNQAGH